MNAEHEARQATSARTVLLVFGMNRPRIDSTLPALVARVQPTRALERKKCAGARPDLGSLRNYKP